MKPMIRRLRLLEKVYQVAPYVEREDSLVAIIRARRRRACKLKVSLFLRRHPNPSISRAGRL